MTGGDARAAGPRWLLRLADASYHASAVVMLLTMLAISGNALLRYLFHGGVSGVYDVARFAFPFIIFLGLTRTDSDGGHARVRLLIAALPRRGQHILLHRVVPLLSMTYMLALFVSGAGMTWAYAASGSRTSGVVAIPLAPVTAIIPVTTALYLAVQGVRLVRSWSDRTIGPDELASRAGTAAEAP